MMESFKKPKRKLSETTDLTIAFEVPFDLNRAIVHYQVSADLHYKMQELFDFRFVSSASGSIMEEKKRILFAATAKFAIFTLEVDGEGEKRKIEETTIPYLQAMPTAIDIGNGLMVVGSDKGHLDVFDPFLFKYPSRSINSIENPLRKNEAVELVRFIPGKTAEVMAVFSDAVALMFRYNNYSSLPEKSGGEIILNIRAIEQYDFENSSKFEKSSGHDFQVKYEFCPFKTFGVAYLDNPEAYPKINPFCAFKFPSHIKDIQFSPYQCPFFPESEVMVALASSDPLLRIINITTKKSFATFKSYYGNFLCLDFSKDGRLLAAGAEDDSISVFDLTKKECLCRCIGHRAFISSVKFDPTFEAQLNSTIIQEDSSKEAARGAEALALNFRKITESELIAALRQAHLSTPGMEKTKAVYRLISTAHDCAMQIWDIDVNRATLQNNFHSGKLQRRGSISFPKDSKSVSENIIDYSSLFLVYTLEPVIKERIHAYPIVKMECFQSFIFTISQSGNFRLFQPHLHLQEGLVDDETEGFVESENPNVEIKLSSFKSKQNLDLYYQPRMSKKS